MGVQTIRQIKEDKLGRIINRFASQFNNSDTPYLDAQVLMAHILGKTRPWVISHPEFTLSSTQLEQLNWVMDQIEANTPLPYIIGHWDFFGLEFIVQPSVLIPRPETEILVEESIRWLKDHPKCRKAVDIGTGSGCVAISLAYHIPDLYVIAVDISKDALNIAFENATKHKVVNRMRFIHSDLFENIPKVNLDHVDNFDLITANLPYIPSKTLQKLDVFGREPTLALDGGDDGLLLIRRLIQSIPKYLSPGGLALMEIEANQGQLSLDFTQQYIPDAQIKILPDLSGFDRILMIQT